MIPTAEEFFEEKYGIADRIFTRNAALLAKEFAKLHVEAALKAAAQKAQIHRKPTGEGESSEEYISNSFEGDLGYEDYIPVEYSIYKESILNAYHLTNII